MSYPINLQETLHFLLGKDGREDGSWRVRHRGGIGEFNMWDNIKAGRRQPTEQEIADVLSDVTQVNGQLFSAWQAENGGNPGLSRRKKLRDRIVTPEEKIRVAVMASLTGKTIAEVRQAYRDAIAAGVGD